MAQLKDLIVNGSSRLIGDAMAPTPAAGTNDQQVATTAFVKTAINNAITSAAQSKTITMPTSNEQQTVTPDANKVLSSVTVESMAAGALSASDSSISGNSFTPGLSYNSSSGKFDFTGSATASGTAYAKVSTQGHVTSSQNTSKSLSATVSATGSVATVGTDVTISGSTTIKPTPKRMTKPSGDSWTDAASGNATGTKPSSGPYVKVGSDPATGTLTATPKVSSAGYGTTDHYGSQARTATVGAAEGNEVYIPITTTSASVSGPTVSYGTGWITGGSKTVSTGALNAGVSGNITFTPSVSTTMSSSTSKPSGTDGTDYFSITGSGSKSGTVTGTAGVATHGYVTNQTATGGSATGSVGSNAVKYVPKGTCTVSGGGLSKGTASGGGLSGGGLSAGAGEVSITTNPAVTPSVSGTGVNSTSQTNFGVTTSKPSGTDGTNYVTFDPSGSVSTTGKAKGRGSVSRAQVDRAAFSQTVSRAAVTDTHTAGYIKDQSATTVISAGSETVSLAAGSIAKTTGTSNWSNETTITPKIEEGTNWYVPVVTASATGGTASASASIAKDPAASAIVTGMETTTTNTGYSVSASASSGYSTASASAAGGSASVGKGITSGASASGTSTGNKSATSTEKTASASKFIIASSVANNTSLPSGQSSSGTINRGSYIKFGKGYNPNDLYYQAQGDAHSPYAPNSTYFQTGTTGAVLAAKINANQYAPSNYYVKATSASVSGPTVSYGSGWIDGGSKTVASGSAGTPSATKGSVSNHQISITPKCTSTTGYITGGTASGTAVTVKASDLVSGSETKTANGTYDVTNLASLVVAIPVYDGSVT